MAFLENLYFRRVSRSLCELFDAFFQGYVPSVNPHYDLTENTDQFDVYRRGNDKKCQKTVRSTTFFLSNHVTAAFIKTESKYLTQRFLENTQYSAALSRNPPNRWIICSFFPYSHSYFPNFKKMLSLSLWSKAVTVNISGRKLKILCFDFRVDERVEQILLIEKHYQKEKLCKVSIPRLKHHQLHVIVKRRIVKS